MAVMYPDERHMCYVSTLRSRRIHGAATKWIGIKEAMLVSSHCRSIKLSVHVTKIQYIQTDKGRDSGTALGMAKTYQRSTRATNVPCLYPTVVQRLLWPDRPRSEASTVVCVTDGM
jgi:hypothetical protein